MSIEQLEQQIQRLPPQDLARLVGWLDGFLDRQPLKLLLTPMTCPSTSRPNSCVAGTNCWPILTWLSPWTTTISRA